MGLVLCIVLAYPFALLAFFVLLGLVGYLGVEEIVVPRPLRWLPRWFLAPSYGFKPCDATTAGYCTIFYQDEPGEVLADLRVHEGFHRFQARRATAAWPLPAALRYLLGPPVYAVTYVREYLKHGYRDNKFEVEARQAAGQG